MCDTCNCDYLKHSKIHFNLIEAKTHRLFLHKAIGSDNSFTLIEKKIQVFKIA